MWCPYCAYVGYQVLRTGRHYNPRIKPPDKKVADCIDHCKLWIHPIPGTKPVRHRIDYKGGLKGSGWDWPRPWLRSQHSPLAHPSDYTLSHCLCSSLTPSLLCCCAMRRLQSGSARRRSVLEG
jgi:hypothetical protein